MKPSPLPAHVVSVRTIPLDEPREPLLVPEEEARAARFHFERDRARWINARSALRDVLARHLNVPPLDLRFTAGAHGKPAVEGVQFNLSHSGGWAMIAVSGDVPVGIDIEVIREGVDMARLLGRVGEPRHPAALAELFQRWTRREARTKALGTPLLHPPAGDLRVADLRAPQGLVASLALVGFDPDVFYQP